MKWIGSPNFTKGRENKSIKFFVVHWFGAGTLKDVDATFQNKGRNTSAHFAIEDEEIHQYVKEEDTAYHAGDWIANTESIGIEHSGTPERSVTEKTYLTSAKLIADLAKKYKIEISEKTILPHKKFRATQCPGTLDIDKIIKMAKELNSKSDDECKSKLKKALQEKDKYKKRSEDYEKTIKKQDEELKKAFDLISSLQEKIDKLENELKDKDTLKPNDSSKIDEVEDTQEVIKVVDKLELKKTLYRLSRTFFIAIYSVGLTSFLATFLDGLATANSKTALMALVTASLIGAISALGKYLRDTIAKEDYSHLLHKNPLF